MTERHNFYTFPSWLLGDHLGSTSMTANAGGTFHSEARYSAFGEIRYQNGTLTTDYLYTGQRQEAEVGLYYYVARWYDPAIGRFIQADSVVPDPGLAVGLDRFAYGFNNPLMYSDPSGQTPIVQDCGFYGTCTDTGSTIDDFSQSYGVVFSGNWLAQDQLEIIQGVEAIGNALMKETGSSTASAAFYYVFGNMEFRWIDAVCEIQGETCAADAYLGPKTIRFWDRYFFDPDGKKENRVFLETTINAELLVHEMGHILDLLTSRELSDSVESLVGDAGRSGFSLRKSNSTHDYEVAADYFLNWVFGGFIGSDSERLMNGLNNDWERLIILAVNYSE